jgi:serine/threonine-protein kinase
VSAAPQGSASAPLREAPTSIAPSAKPTIPRDVTPFPGAERRPADLQLRYDAARDALQRALLALRSRDEKIAELERDLLSRGEALEDLGRELALTSSRLSDSHQSSCRLFDAFCSSLPGKVLGGRFEIVQHIGSGGYGVVYQAVDRKTHREIALKLLRNPGGSRSESSWGALPLPGSPAFQLAHPNIAAILDTGIATEGIPFVAMELLRGRNVADVLRERRSLSAGHAMHIAHAVSLGLAEAHRWNVVHRDIKPANVFLARLGGGTVVKILDFGMARVMPQPEVDYGPIAGTPSYVAPERLRREAYDARVDVYSLGVLIYALLGVAVEPPGDARVSGAPTPALHEVRADVPRPLSLLAARAIRQSPGSRPTAAEMATALGEQLCYPAHLSELLSHHPMVVTGSKDITLESVELAAVSRDEDTMPHLKSRT